MSVFQYLDATTQDGTREPGEGGGGDTRKMREGRSEREKVSNVSRVGPKVDDLTGQWVCRTIKNVTS